MNAAAPALAVAPAAETALAEQSGPRLQRKCSCEEGGSGCARCSGARPKLQRKSLGGAAAAGIPNHAHAVITSQGRPLDARTRGIMEPRLGFDFSAVRIHSDDHARDSSRRLSAAAYTVGTHIVLGESKPASPELQGDSLMAHELAHVVQQSRPGVDFDEGGLELEADDAARAVDRGGTFTVRGSAGPSVQRAEAESGHLKEDVLNAIMERAKNELGLSSTSARLLIAGVQGTVEGFHQQWTEGKTGERLGKRIKEFSLWDVPKLWAGYVVGLLQGVVSPITDLFSIAVLLEQLRDFGLKIADSVISRRHELKAALDELVGGLANLAQPLLDVLRDMKKDKLKTLRMLLDFAQSQGGMMEKMEGMAKSAGHAGGEALAKSFESPWEEKKEAPKELSFKRIFQSADQLMERAGEAVLFGPWGKIGNKAGYVVGFAAVQVAMLVFSGGMGNLITTIGKALGGLGKAGTLLGKTIGGIAKFVQAAGKFIEVIEGAVHAVTALLTKPIMPVLEPILKPFGVLMDRMGKFLRKLFNVAEKESAHLLTTAVAKVEGAVPAPHVPAPHAHAPAPHAPAPHAPAPHATAPRAPAPAPAKAPPKPAPTAEPHTGAAQPHEPPAAHKPAAAPKKEPAPASKDAAKPAEAHADSPATNDPAKPESAGAKAGERDVGGKAPAKPNERGAVVAEESVDGHEVRVRERGDIELCSNEPCPLLENVYGDIIGGSEPLKLKMDAIRGLRKTNPAKAAKQSAALKKELDAIRKKSTPSQAKLDKEFDDFNKLITKEGGDPVTSRKPGKTAGSTASKEHPTAQDTAQNVDEIKPVGGAKHEPGLTQQQALQEGRNRALDIDNRDIKDALTNQRTKHLGVDQREVAKLGNPRDPVSLRPGTSKATYEKGKLKGQLVGNEHLALFDRRFSEIEETKAIGEEILKTIEGKTTRAPGDLKTEFNAKFWDVVRNPGKYEGKLAKNGKIVAEAMERGGFGLIEAPNGNMYFRALSETELEKRGFKYVQGQGWIPKGAAP